MMPRSTNLPNKAEWPILPIRTEKSIQVSHVVAPNEAVPMHSLKSSKWAVNIDRPVVTNSASDWGHNSLAPRRSVVWARSLVLHLMADTFLALFPLREANIKHLRQLGQALWDWNLCDICRDHAECLSVTCPWSRAKRLKTFWNRYEDLTEAYVPEYPSTQPALSSHEDRLRIIQTIRDHPDTQWEELLRGHFTRNQHDSTNDTVILDQNRAFNIAASVMFLVNCGTSLESADFLEEGGSSISWGDNMTARTFVREAYPEKAQPIFHDTSNEKYQSHVIEQLAVQNLVKAGFRFEPTSDLRSHLTLDYSRGRKVLRVFHCAGVLKEMLSAQHSNTAADLLPRSLILKALDTIYHVLFPPDGESQAVLSKLIRKHHFDDELRQYEWSRYERDDNLKVEYSYFGTRLIDIYDEIQNPTPCSGWETWFQKYSAQRYMLMATVMGVLLAVILGFLGLIVSVFQAWMAYKQWKQAAEKLG